MSSILQTLANPDNFGKYILEVESWENDGDHYQTNLHVVSSKEELTLLTTMLDVLRDVPKDSGWSNSNTKEYTLFGNTFKTLEELLELDSEAHASENDMGVYVGGLFGNGIYLDHYIELVGGYQYESDEIRQLDSYKTYKLSDIGVLEEI
jgi:hypothetical protein